MVGLAVSAICMASLLACASVPTPAPVVDASGALSSVTVETDGDATVVSLIGLTEPVYNAFRQEEPSRIVVDLAAVSAGDVVPAIAIYDGTIDEVTVESFSHEGASSTRVEVSLAAAGDYTVVDLEDRIEIRVSAVSSEGSTTEAETASISESTPEADPWAVTETSGEEAASVQAEAEVPMTPATILTGVVAEAVGTELTVQLDADGSIEGASWFGLEDPSRLVVDLPGLTSEVEESQLAVSGDRVARIRVGQHEDKVRVVFDGTDEAQGFDDVRVIAVATGLWLGLGDVASPLLPVASAPIETEQTNPEELAEDQDTGSAAAELVVTESTDTELVVAESADTEPVVTESADTEPVATETEVSETDASETDASESEASEPEVAAVEDGVSGDPAAEEAVEDVPAATETAEVWAEEEAFDAAEEAAPATLTVFGVQLESDEARERVVVVTEGPAEYVTSNPSPDTTVIRLKGATIDPDAAVRIAPDAPGSVSLVTAFQQPEAAEPEVRVVIRAQDGAKPVVTQEGALLFLDFETSTQQASEIPMLSDVASAPVPSDSVPASMDPNDDSVEILAEGGLVNGKAYTGRRISLDFKDVEIDDVLRLIAEVSDLNIIAGDEVAGKVTIRLVDVPWDQALDVVLLTRGLGFVRVGNVLRIASSDLLKTEEESRLQERRAKEKLEDLVVKLQPVNYADVSEIEKMVKRLLTARGSVDVDERTNTVILKDIASVIDEATALIKAIDTQTPQVMIEAKIVEANLDFTKELGATWAFGVQQYTDSFNDSSPVKTNERLGLGNDILFHDSSNYLGLDNLNKVAVANPITSIPNGLLDLGAFILDERLNVEARIEAAESYGEGKVISSPRIVTLDNRKASIEQGVSIPFQTFENGDAKLEFIDAVLRLDVTPHITADQSIIMQIAVQRNAPDTSVETPTGSPAIAKNEAETETLVKDGQTLVIGGIYVVDKSETESRVPYFHKIPLLGNAFKNNEVRDIRKELLVFVTPRIVVNSELGS
ncbi:MAG: type IV pilus secretin PilQ [bacterium]|nr:type IV pilus secretin PilQ [bacterium]